MLFGEFENYLFANGVNKRRSTHEVCIDYNCEPKLAHRYENHVGEGVVYRRPRPDNYAETEEIDTLEAHNICNALRIAAPPEIRSIGVQTAPRQE